MRYRLSKSQLHILSTLVFDASIEPDDLDFELTNDQFELTVERRTFESVKRFKWLFWNRTRYLGKTAKLRFAGVSQLEIIRSASDIPGNTFVIDVFYKESTNIVELTTTSGLTLQLTPNSSFIVELEDIKDSNFGKGTSLGKHGYTDTEWKELLIKEEIHAM